MNSKVATDIGGTFTDLVALDETSGKIMISKDPTTASTPFRAIMTCIKKAGLESREISTFVHGSTVAINTLLERKGANTCLITTRGFRDVFEIGRGQRLDMFNPLFRRPEPLISRENRFEVDERIDSNGKVLVPLDESKLLPIVNEIGQRSYNSIAVCLLNSYINPDHEIIIGEVVKKTFPTVSISLSHNITQEYREYERTSSAAINAYITPTVHTYLQGLEGALRKDGCKGRLLMMQSNGGTMSFEDAKMNSLSMIESGPASGVVGAAELSKSLGYENVISFDMGGTTAKASLIESNQPKFTTDYTVLDLPLLVPFIDLVEVGAGGGSIAWVERNGSLKVGPKSAGANPGPACYGWGGDNPTVTDSNLLVGHINHSNFLGGEIPLSVDKARNAMEQKVASRIDKDLDYCVLGILKIANAIMANAIRAVTVERGFDPRDCALIAYGGAGPLHASAMAQTLEVPTIIIPTNPGHFSAMGMLMTDIRHDYALTFVGSLEESNIERVAEHLISMEQKATKRLDEEGIGHRNFRFLRTMEVRYQGQEHTLNVPLPPFGHTIKWKEELTQRFEELYRVRYGHIAKNEPLEIVTLRLAAIGVTEKPSRPKVFSGSKTPPIESLRGKRNVLIANNSNSMERLDFDVYRREGLLHNNRIQGPAIIEEYASTTPVLPGYEATMGPFGDIIISTMSQR